MSNELRDRKICTVKYIKKPVIVEAYQTDKEIIIHTLEGDMKANVGDYIITGVNGEQYPCKPDIFEKTYDIVAEPIPNKESEITEALKIWLEEIRKSRQAYLEKAVNKEHYPSMRYEYLLSSTIHEINRLQAENERLKEENSQYDPFPFCSYSGCEAVSMECWQRCPNSVYNKTKAEAYKECIEKAKERSSNKFWDGNKMHELKVPFVGVDDLDNLLKELVGEDNVD